MAAQKIRVSVADLIEALEAKKVEAEEKYSAEVASYESKVLRAQSKQADALRKAADRVAAGKTIASSYVTSLPGWDATPSKPVRNISGIDEQLRILKLATDSFLVISSDSQFSRYL